MLNDVIVRKVSPFGNVWLYFIVKGAAKLLWVAAGLWRESPSRYQRAHTIPTIHCFRRRVVYKGWMTPVAEALRRDRQLHIVKKSMSKHTLVSSDTEIRK